MGTVRVILGLGFGLWLGFFSRGSKRGPCKPGLVVIPWVAFKLGDGCSGRGFQGELGHGSRGHRLVVIHWLVNHGLGDKGTHVRIRSWLGCILPGRRRGFKVVYEATCDLGCCWPEGAHDKVAGCIPIVAVRAAGVAWGSSGNL